MKQLLHDIFTDSFYELLQKDKQNILDDVSERNLCARLGMYIERDSSKMK